MNKYKSIYMQTKNPINIEKSGRVLIKDLVNIVADKEIKNEIGNIEMVRIDIKDKKHIVIPIISLVEKIKNIYPGLNIHVIGEDKILLKINTIQKNKNKFLELIKVLIVCSILFLGAALAINHFHADVDMGKAHSDIYKLITGKENQRPLLLQIPYSIGLGIGMTIFFYKISPKSTSNEPSPLEIELYLYNQNIEQYMLDKDKNN
jgi:stage V sporulation protein AA